MDLDAIESALRGAGLTPRGAFHPAPADGVPSLRDGVRAGTVVLAGNAGPAMWRAFSAALRAEALTLDRWSQRVIGAIATALGAEAVFPFTRPYLPFQRWAARAESCRPSPLGLLLHPEFGLWHGYRGALLFVDRIPLPRRAARTHACTDCALQPCLHACPAGAYSACGYDETACAEHLARHRRGACMQGGCLARHACPVGSAYAPEQARFHMSAFLREHRRREPLRPASQRES